MTDEVKRFNHSFKDDTPLTWYAVSIKENLLKGKNAMWENTAKKGSYE